MKSTMMDVQLTVTSLIERARRLYSTIEVVSRGPDGAVARSNYAEVCARAKRLAEALTRAGMRRGDRVATLCWNHAAHLEAYLGVPAAGGVAHTLNPRLFAQDIAYIANDAEDRFLIVDDILLPVYEQFRKQTKFERVFVIPFGGEFAARGEYESYEDLLATATGEYEFGSLDEREAAAMCYTSGTTGFPKGVVYSHRSLVLHALSVALPDTFGIAQADTVLPVVPMFHANCWGLAHVATMVGAKLVFPGPRLDARSVLECMTAEQVTMAAGVPTVWMGVLDELDRSKGEWKLNPKLRILVGGAAAPESLLRGFDRHGIPVRHSWGMTEMSPVGTAGTLKSTLADLPPDEMYRRRARQGIAIPLIELRAMNEAGEVAWDEESMGELQARGPFVAASYHGSSGENQQPEKWTDDGWFRTGDVATIDTHGYIKIVDRTKDLIKSGGEWISSVDLENALMNHPAVKEAAVIAVPHPRWMERPLACVVLRENVEVSEQQLREFLLTKFSKWQLPDAIAFVEEIPRTATGKFLKTALRKKFESWTWAENSLPETQP